MTYSNVVMNPQVGIEQFAFEPPAGARVIDETQAIVTDLSAALAASRRPQGRSSPPWPGTPQYTHPKAPLLR